MQLRIPVVMVMSLCWMSFLITLTVDWSVCDRPCCVGRYFAGDRLVCHSWGLPIVLHINESKILNTLLYFRSVEQDKLWGRLTTESPGPLKNYWIDNSAVLCAIKRDELFVLMTFMLSHVTAQLDAFFIALLWCISSRISSGWPTSFSNEI